MKLLRVAAATLNQTPLDWEGNARRIRAVLAAARNSGVGLLCLPELCITGYGCEDAFLSPAVASMALRVLEELLPETKDLCVCFGLPIVRHKAVYNACCLVLDGEILGFVGKRALAGDGIHYEPRWFKPWPEGERTLITTSTGTHPAGNLVFEVGGVRNRIRDLRRCMDCGTAWCDARPSCGRCDLESECEPFAFGKHEVRRRLVVEGARAFGVTYVYSNLLGNEAGRVIYDGDAIIANSRAILACNQRFSFEEYKLVHAVVDVESTRTEHCRQSSYRPEVNEPPDALVAREHTFPSASLPSRRAFESDHFVGGATKYEEFTSALTLGLFDYLRKSYSKGFVVSLSGGADSSAIASLVHLMVKSALRELGREGLRARLAYVSGIEACASSAEFTARLLTTVYQATKNSSTTTRTAASTLAHAIGSRHLELDVDELVEGYERIVSRALGRQLDWARDDLALQNIQARTRAPSVWLIANLEGALLLATSNRSEAAVGYATMDGDTAGGLSPIAGIDKAFIRRYLVWLEREGPKDLGAIPALSAVNVQAPTAELRPSSEAQTDERDLMPYDVLDVIERAMIGDKRGPSDVFEVLRVEFPSHEEGELLAWLERFYALFCRNQWKRERYAPSFHVDDANLDPKTWYRFPILSGGFRRELAELRRRLGR
ncbi:MAG: NAD(+) synthase [Polyangiaceae bacterium]